MPGARDRPDDEPDRASLRGAVRASGLLAILGLAARKDKGSRSPQIVRGGPEVDAVVAGLAEQLAEQGREDEASVQELRRGAKGRRRALRPCVGAVAGGSDADDGLFEFRSGSAWIACSSSAATGDAVQPVSAEQASWFETMDALNAGGSEVAYARLKAQVPDLDLLEQHVRTRSEARGHGAAFDHDWLESVDERLGQLVGWKSKNADPILRSGMAFEIAYDHLARIAGIFDD